MSDNHFDFSLWKRICKKQHEDAEAYRRKALHELWDALTVLYESYKWDELFIFGSITKEGCFFHRSDVDIGVSGLDKFLQYSFIAKLSTMLNRDVDVVRLEECRFAKTILSRGIQWNKNKPLSF